MVSARTKARRLFGLSVVAVLVAGPMARADSPGDAKALPLAATSASNTAAPLSSPPAPRAKVRPSPVTLVVSGGVSLGAYQAGFLYTLVETMKRNPELLDLKIATGASAGSTNGLLSLIASCEPPQPDPTESMLFRSWKDIGFPDLFEPKKTTAIAAFSRTPMDRVAERLEEHLKKGLSPTCDVVLGVSTTRLTSKKRPLGPNSALELPHTEEKFVVRLRGRGPGKTPLFENYVDATYGFPQGLLPLADEGRAVSAVRDLLYASSAYPFAFAPVPLAHCMTDPEHPKAVCTAETAISVPFIDGGVFDNQPLGLAARLAGDGFAQSYVGAPRTLFASPLKRRNAAAPDDALFMYVDPHLRSYPALPSSGEEERTTYSATRLALHYLNTFVASALSKELVDVLEASPELRDKLVLSVADVPPIGENLENFFGLFDANLRVFDFYLGMRGARRFVEGPLQEAIMKRHGVAPVVSDGEDAAGNHLEPYRCLRAVLDRHGDSRERCKAASPEFRAVLQTSIAKLYDRCASVHAKKGMTAKAPACALLVGEPPRVPFVPARPQNFHRQRPNEGELAYAVRLLSGYGFVFHDLELEDEHADASVVERAILTRLREILEAFGAAQPESRILVDGVARTLLGQLNYVPPALIVHAGIGSVIEGGASLRLGTGATSFLRATAALDAGGLTSFSGGGGAYFTLAPMAGLEAELLPLSGPNVQPRIGLRGGYLFSTSDTFSFGTCATPDKRVCSRATAQVYGAVSLFERFRLQVAFAMLPALRSGEDFSWSILPTAGVQFLWP